MKWYIATLKRDFAKNGFISSPLTDAQIVDLYKRNIKLEVAYGVGCDVNSGFDFDYAVEVNL